MHTPLGETDAPQVLVAGGMPKSPVAAMEASASGTPPLLLRVMVWGAAERPTPVGGKVRPPSGEMETPGGASPVPVRAMVWVRNWSAIARVPVWGPVAWGLNVTEAAQVECGERELPQALNTAKLPLRI